MLTFSANLASNAGAGAPFTGASTPWGGGRGLLTVSGTFGGTSVTLEYQGAGGAWYPVQAMSDAAVFTTIALTAAGAFPFELPPANIRLVAAGGTPSAMNAQADRILY